MALFGSTAVLPATEQEPGWNGKARKYRSQSYGRYTRAQQKLVDHFSANGVTRVKVLRGTHELIQSALHFDPMLTDVIRIHGSTDPRYRYPKDTLRRLLWADLFRPLSTSNGHALFLLDGTSSGISGTAALLIEEYCEMLPPEQRKRIQVAGLISEEALPVLKKISTHQDWLVVSTPNVLDPLVPAVQVLRGFATRFSDIHIRYLALDGGEHAEALQLMVEVGWIERTLDPTAPTPEMVVDLYPSELPRAADGSAPPIRGASVLAELLANVEQRHSLLPRNMGFKVHERKNALPISEEAWTVALQTAAETLRVQTEEASLAFQSHRLNDRLAGMDPLGDRYLRLAEARLSTVQRVQEAMNQAAEARVSLGEWKRFRPEAKGK